MLRETDFTPFNPPDDIPPKRGPIMLDWPRKPLSGKPRANGPARNPYPHSKSGLHKFHKRVTHPDPYF